MRLANLLVCRLPGAASENTPEEIQAAVAALQSEITEVNGSIQALEIASPELKQSFSATGSSKTHKDLVKDLRKIADGAKKFRPKNSANDFWLTFSYTCVANYLPDVESILLLNLLISEHPVARMWFENTIEPSIKENQCPLSLPQVKQAFYEQFLAKDWKMIKFQELMEIKYHKKETVRDFTNRFTAKAAEIELDVKATDDGLAYLQSILLYKCPPSVQRILGARTPTSFPSCQALIAALVNFSGTPEDVPDFESKCPDCSKVLSCTCTNSFQKRRSTASGINPASTKKPFTPCSLHGTTNNHTTEDCNVLKKERETTTPRNTAPSFDAASSSSSASPFRPSKNNGLRMCRNGCGQVFTPGHECPNKSQSGPSVNAIHIKDDAFGPENLQIHLTVNPDNFKDDVKEEEFLELIDYEDDWETGANDEPSVNAVAPGSDKGNYLTCPLRIANHAVLAAIDTMATKSLITPAFLEVTKGILIPVRGQISLAAKGSTIPRMGQTTLAVDIKGKSFTHTFEVLPLNPPPLHTRVRYSQSRWDRHCGHPY